MMKEKLRKIHAGKISKDIEALCLKANYNLREDIVAALRKAYEKEKVALARFALQQMLENIEIARKEKIPLCQDTGMCVVFLEIGQNIRIIGNLEKAINKGIRNGYKKGYLRNSVIKEPCFSRLNTGDNTPAIIHTKIVTGNRCKITLVPKGFGSENMSRLAMLKPAEGLSGIERFVLDTVKEGGLNACPPLIVGIGIGGSFDNVGLLAKEALLRPLNKHNPDKKIARWEKRLLEKINLLKIGPAGLGGKTTALGVHIETYATHITALPVAVNLCCWALRQAEINRDGHLFFKDEKDRQNNFSIK